MNTVEIQRYLNSNNRRNIVMKVCAIDQLPKNINKGTEYGFVINLSKSDDIGTHWTSIYINKDGKSSYMDSYGFKPRGYHIESFIKKNCKHFQHNIQQLQQLNSKVCGMYAALFILHMMNGGTIHQFISILSKNLFLNDLVVEKLYHSNNK